MARNTKRKKKRVRRISKITQRGLAALEKNLRKRYPKSGVGPYIRIKPPNRFLAEALADVAPALKKRMEESLQNIAQINKTYEATIPMAQPERRQEERINHPSHYGGDTIYEVIKVIDAWELGFALGNAIKYIARAGKKFHTSDVEDLKKARWYIDHEIQRREKEKTR